MCKYTRLHKFTLHNMNLIYECEMIQTSRGLMHMKSLEIATLQNYVACVENGKDLCYILKEQTTQITYVS